MYYIIMTKRKEYIQVRDTDRKACQWSKSFPFWNEKLTSQYGSLSDPFNLYGYTIVAASEFPMTPQTHPEFCI